MKSDIATENLKEETIEKKYVYRGKIFSIRCDDARRPDGKPCKREIVEHAGGAGVLYAEDGKVLLVRQYRYAFSEVLWEIPAGKLERDEDPAAAAKRELSEEAGIDADEMQHICTYYPTCGYSEEKIYIYRALGCRRGAAHPDEGEFLNAFFLPVEEVWKMIRSGEIKDSKTIIAVQAYLLEERENGTAPAQA